MNEDKSETTGQRTDDPMLDHACTMRIALAIARRQNELDLRLHRIEQALKLGGHANFPSTDRNQPTTQKNKERTDNGRGEKNIIGDRFSPSVIIFWLKTSIAASSTRIQYTTPNTLFGLIPLGADTKTIPLRNVASVDTSTKFNLGSLVWGVVFLLIGLGCLDSSVAVALVLILVAASNLANTMSAQLDFVNQAGGRNSVKVSILEKDKLMQLAQNIQRLVFADVEGQRHQESMDMAQKQYTAQTRSVLIQQQMLDQQRKATADDNPSMPTE